MYLTEMFTIRSLKVHCTRVRNSKNINLYFDFFTKKLRCLIKYLIVLALKWHSCKVLDVYENYINKSDTVLLK